MGILLKECGALEHERFLRRARLQPHQCIEHVLADQSAVEHFSQDLAGFHIDGADGEIEGVVDAGQAVEIVGALREAQKLVVADRGWR